MYAIAAATTPGRFSTMTKTSNITIIAASSIAVATEIGPVVPFTIRVDL